MAIGISHVAMEKNHLLGLRERVDSGRAYVGILFVARSDPRLEQDRPGPTYMNTTIDIWGPSQW